LNLSKPLRSTHFSLRTAVQTANHDEYAKGNTDGEPGRLDRPRRRLADGSGSTRSVPHGESNLPYQLFDETPNRATETVALPLEMYGSA